VSPAKGVMLETLFSMVSLSWVDEDLPLSYQFGYLSTSPSNKDNGMIVLRSKMELSYTSTLLPSGFTKVMGLPSNLSCAVIVFDNMDSYSRSSSEVSVRDTLTSVKSLGSFLLSGLNTFRVNNNPDDLRNSLSCVSTVLNRVNCSEAPDCLSLHRSPCSQVEGTCGECLSGFVGSSGSSNTRCISTTSSHRSLSDITSSTTPISCSSDEDCDSAGLVFSECEASSQLCQPIQQSCPNSCSGHGSCVFRSKYNLSTSVSLLPECDVSDVDGCVSLCECVDGFMGSSCSLSSAEFLEQKSLRSLMVESVRDMMSLENLDRISWIRTLSSIGSDSLSLSLESKLLMTSLTIDLLQMTGDVEVSVEELLGSGLDVLVDMCVSGLSSSFSSSNGDANGAALDLLMTLVSAYSEVFTTDMTEGQFPLSSVTSNLRSSSFYISPSSPTSEFSIPETALESFVNTLRPKPLAPPSIELFGEDILPLQLSLSEIQPSFASSSASTSSSNQSTQPMNETQLSLPLVVSLHNSPCSSKEGRGECEIRVFLQNKFKQHTQSSHSLTSSTLSTSEPSSPLSFETVCALHVTEEHAYLCPSGEVLSVTCNGSYSGRGRSYCPLHSQVAECRMNLHTSLATSLSTDTDEQFSCRVEEFNESMTVCACNLSTLATVIGRNGGTVSFSLFSMEKSVTSDFASTWKSTATLSVSDVSQSWTVLLSLSCIVVLFVFSLLLTMSWDSEDKKRRQMLLTQTKGKSQSQTNSRPPPWKARFSHAISAQQHHPQPSPTPFVPIPPTQLKPPNRSKANEYLKLIDESLPSVFKSDSLWLKFKEEVKVYHRWLGIVFYYSPVFPRSMRVLSLFSSIVIMLFVQSVTYNIADPDDGSCEACEDENCCLSLRSTLNSNQDRCYWTASSSFSSSDTNSSEGSCHFREISHEMGRVFIVAMLSAVVSAPLALSIQYLICNVLSKEVVLPEEVKAKSNLVALKRVQRLLPSHRGSVRNVGDPSLSLVELCGKTPMEDLKNLRDELSDHYNHLVSSPNCKPEEFRGLFPLFSFHLFFFPHLSLRGLGNIDRKHR
jgi:hypothetical protein